MRYYDGFLQRWVETDDPTPVVSGRESARRGAAAVFEARLGHGRRARRAVRARPSEAGSGRSLTVARNSKIFAAPRAGSIGRTDYEREQLRRAADAMRKGNRKTSMIALGEWYASLVEKHDPRRAESGGVSRSAWRRKKKDTRVPPCRSVSRRASSWSAWERAGGAVFFLRNPSRSREGIRERRFRDRLLASPSQRIRGAPRAQAQAASSVRGRARRLGCARQSPAPRAHWPAPQPR